MPWAVAAACAAAAASSRCQQEFEHKAAQTLAGALHKAAHERGASRMASSREQTHCEPCGAPLEASTCSYCKTAAKAWRAQREEPAAGADAVMTVRYGFETVLPVLDGRSYE